MTDDPAAAADSGILATDLDGTLIPLDGDPQNRSDLQTLTTELAHHRLTLIFVTGRHLESVVEAIGEYQLPPPDWVICDVGTSIFRCQASAGFEPVEAYQQHQSRIVASLPMSKLQQRLESIDGLRLQEPEKQGPFKLSYYAKAEQLDRLAGRIQQQLDQTDAPYSIIHSVDPFNGDGLIDLLPANVSKAHALEWWVQYAGFKRESVVFAGDSGNDLAALIAGYRTIVVANADRRLARQVQDAHRAAGWKDRLHLARGPATSGVLEGCRRFELLGRADKRA